MRSRENFATEIRWALGWKNGIDPGALFELVMRQPSGLLVAFMRNGRLGITKLETTMIYDDNRQELSREIAEAVSKMVEGT